MKEIFISLYVCICTFICDFGCVLLGGFIRKENTAELSWKAHAYISGLLCCVLCVCGGMNTQIWDMSANNWLIGWSTSNFFKEFCCFNREKMHSLVFVLIFPNKTQFCSEFSVYTHTYIHTNTTTHTHRTLFISLPYKNYYLNKPHYCYMRHQNKFSYKTIAHICHSCIILMFSFHVTHTHTHTHMWRYVFKIIWRRRFALSGSLFYDFICSFFSYIKKNILFLYINLSSFTTSLTMWKVKKNEWI